MRQWLAERRATIASISVGIVTWPVALVLGWQLWPARTMLAAPGDRIAYAAQWLAAVAALVALMVTACFRMFDTKAAENPFANAESPGWKVHQRVLQNTVEQIMIFVPALLALAARIDAAHAWVLGLLTVLWCTGRVLFWIGYRIKPVLRGPGFDWTLFSALFALGWFAYTLT